ncbi:MAG TPA: TonB-dependent receptor [Gemmatimonadaceae bacterium]|nr:TonB-dependent receptor [Gemmatimonadaceae bacterium]
MPRRHVPAISMLLALAAAVGARAAPLRAQADTTGRVTVTVRHAGEPLRDATVHSGRTGALTDSTGRASLSLPAGPRAVIVARLGFRPETLRVVVRAHADTALAVAMEEQAAKLEEAVVTVSRTELQVEDEPLRVEVMAGEEINEKTQSRPADLSYLLREMSGVHVQPTSPALGAAGLRIQGLRSQYALVLSDGLPLYGAQPGGLGLLQIPPLDLQRAEVIKGAASALYGTAALGGVLNLVSKRPADERAVLFNQTSREGTDGALWLSRKASERWGWTLLGGAHRQGMVETDGDGWADLPSFTRAEVRPRLFWTGADGSMLLMTVGAMGEDRTGGTVEGATTPAGSDFVESVATRRADGGLVGRWMLGGGRVASVRGSAAFREERRRQGDERERGRFGSGFIEASLTLPQGRALWVVGAALQRDLFRSREVPAADYTFTTPSLFAQLTWAPAHRLSLAASGRCDDQSAYGTFCTPRLSVLLRPAADWSVRLSGGGGVYAPTPFSEETEGMLLSRLRLPLRLRAERAWNTSLDLMASLGPLDLTGTLYASTLTHPARLRALGTGTPPFVELVNAPSETRTYGGELIALYKREPITVIADYAYLRSTEWDPATDSRREVPRNPRHSGGVDVAWEEEETGSRVGLEIFYTGPQSLDEDPYRTRSRSFATVGLLVTRRFGPAQLYINGEDLTDIRQTDYEPLLLPARSPEGRWTTQQWAPLEGRTVNAGVRLAF